MNSSPTVSGFTHPGPREQTDSPAVRAAAKRGRRCSFSMEKLDAICALIRDEGLSNGAAGARVGVPHTTLSRWKAQYEEAEVELTKARALYQVPRLEKLAQARRKDGRVDWRAQAWLIKFAAPEVYGPPSRRRRLRNVVISDETAIAEMPVFAASTCALSPVRETKSVTFSPEMADAAATALPAGAERAQSVTFSPETPSAAPCADRAGASALKSVTFSPEMTLLVIGAADLGCRPSASGVETASRPDVGRCRGLACLRASGAPQSHMLRSLAA